MIIENVEKTSINKNISIFHLHMLIGSKAWTSNQAIILVGCSFSYMPNINGHSGGPPLKLGMDQ